jgi:hypothetical protein
MNRLLIDLRKNEKRGERAKTTFRAIFTLLMIEALIINAGCTLTPNSPATLPTATLRSGAQVLTADEIATLSSLEQLDEFPLYTMRYQGTYSTPILSTIDPRLAASTELAFTNMQQAIWGCSLFAALGDPDQRLYGRNFDWRPSPALLLFTDPPDGYASAAMVDMEYLGFTGSRAKNLLDLPLDKRQALLDAPVLPFDGMNEKGMAIGMAAVPASEIHPDPDKKTIDQLAVIREILDHASTVDKAVNILGSYNIDMGSVPLHYLVSSAMGNSALVEFYQGKMAVFWNEAPWQLATNFLVASTGGHPQGQCPRYDRISQRMQASEGQLSVAEALSLLREVSQDNPGGQSDTQWSVVYDMTAGEVNIVMGRKYAGGAHNLKLSRPGLLYTFPLKLINPLH